MAPRRVKNSRAYQYAVGALNFVKVGLLGPVISTSSVGGAVENLEVVMMDAVAKKDIGN